MCWYNETGVARQLNDGGVLLLALCKRLNIRMIPAGAGGRFAAQTMRSMWFTEAGTREDLADVQVTP